MLLVNAKKSPSGIHGMGLFAQEFIPEGTVIWKFAPGFDLKICAEKLSLLSDPARVQVLQYAYFDPESGCHVLSSDDDRFTNHSPTPNTFTRSHQTIAARDILAGEEITANYAELHLEEEGLNLIAAKERNWTTG